MGIIGAQAFGVRGTGRLGPRNGLAERRTERRDTVGSVGQGTAIPMFWALPSGWFAPSRAGEAVTSRTALGTFAMSILFGSTTIRRNALGLLCSTRAGWTVGGAMNSGGQTSDGLRCAPPIYACY